MAIAGIPAYNEQETIAEVVEETLTCVDEVLVVDDGSTDETANRAERAGATVIRHGRNRGYGAALKTLFEQAARRNATCLAVVDADGQHDPGDIEKLVAAQRETEADIVIGSRFVPGAWTNIPLYRRVGVGIVNVLMNLSIGTIGSGSYITDTQSGFRVYSQRAIQSLVEDPDIGGGMNASTDIIFHAQSRGYTFEEVPTSVDYTVVNASSQHPVTHGLELVKNIFANVERRHPIRLLGVPGVLSLLVGLAIAYWSFQNYLVTDTFPLGVALVSVLFTLVGLFAYGTAIVRHAVNQSSERP
jgi:glycosyltransferase involved in cell wall biosynthesis